MDSQSKFNEILTIFERVRPAIERGIALMQPIEQKKAEKIWQELIVIVETGDDDIKTFADKLSKFNEQVCEYQSRSRVLASDIKMKVI